MAEKTIDAVDVRNGQTVTRIVAKAVTRWRKRPATIDQDVRKTRGKWPTVTDAHYLEHGEGGQPTVYLELNDAPGWTYCLAPNDQVTVED